MSGRTNPLDRIDNGVDGLNSLDEGLFTADTGTFSRQNGDELQPIDHYKNSYNNRSHIIKKSKVLQESLEYLTTPLRYTARIPFARALLVTGTLLSLLACRGELPPVTPTNMPRDTPPATAKAPPTKEPSSVLVPIVQAAESTATPVPAAPAAPPTEVPLGIVPNKPTVTPPTATPTPQLKPFELVCPSCTPEQFKIFYDNALEDYREVLKVYGIGEREARMVVSVRFDDFAGRGGFSAGFFYNGSHGSGVGTLDSLTTDRRQARHEMSHAVNYVLLSRDIPSWLDEGLAMYGSGELTHPGYSSNYIELKEKGEKWFVERKTLGVNAGHLLGSTYFTALEIDYGMTQEKNRTALSLMRKKYLEDGEAVTMPKIQQAYESALNTKLTPLFDLLKSGITTLGK